MGMQKYRADVSETQSDGAIVWSANWMGGPTVSRIDSCRLEKLVGEPRATVYIVGEPDMYFSIPAMCNYRGVRMAGYVTGDGDGNLVFRHTYY